MIIIKKILIVAVIFLASCAPAKKYVWTRPGVTQEEGMKDRLECRTIRDNFYYQAVRSVPSPQQSTGMRTSGAGLAEIGDSMAYVGAINRIKEDARELFVECMESKGYNLVEKPSVNQ